MKIDVLDKTSVTLDTYNCDLNLVIDATRYSARPLTNEGFAFMWAGARATHGASSGKFCFEVKILNHIDVSHLPVDEPNTHVVRVGFSVNPASLQLGEASLSYCYDGTGKIGHKSRFKDFGQPFQAGDVILAAVNIDADVVQIGFAKNGIYLGWAYRISKRIFKGRALFPHVLAKNVSFEVNFGQKEASYFPLPDILKEYVFISCVPSKQRQSGTSAPKEIENCEVIMMCGLPSAGKSVWAAEYSRLNPKKKYNILGTKHIIDKMKVMGLPRKMSYSGNWNELIQMSTTILNRLLDIGTKFKRNYILDQTNVYPCARQMKMQDFEGFQFKAVVIIPSEIEYKRRCDKQYSEEGKQVPDEAILEMKANFKLPEVKDGFSEVIYPDLPKTEAEKLVAKYNAEGKAAIGPPRKQFKPNDPPSACGFTFLNYKILDFWGSAGNDRSLDSGQRNRNRSLDPRRRNRASSALGRNPQRDSEGGQSENYSNPSGQMNTEVVGVNPMIIPHNLFGFPEEELLQPRYFGFPPAFPPTFLSDTCKELWGMPNTLQQMQPQPSQCLGDQDPNHESSITCLDVQDSDSSPNHGSSIICLDDEDQKSSPNLESSQSINDQDPKSPPNHESGQSLDDQDPKSSQNHGSLNDLK